MDWLRIFSLAFPKTKSARGLLQYALHLARSMTSQNATELQSVHRL